MVSRCNRPIRQAYVEIRQSGMFFRTEPTHDESRHSELHPHVNRFAELEEGPRPRLAEQLEGQLSVLQAPDMEGEKHALQRSRDGCDHGSRRGVSYDVAGP